jgi:hypothetical protein
VDYAIAVTLKIISVGMGRFRMATSARIFHPHRVTSQHG